MTPVLKFSAVEIVAPSATARWTGASARRFAFVAVFALAMVTLKPFADLQAALPSGPVSGNDVPTYFAFLALAGIGLALVRQHATAAFAALNRPALLALGVWIVVTALLSYDPSTSLKRAALCLLVAATAAIAPLLPRGRSELASLLAIAVAIPIALSFAGVAFLPQLSIHSLADVLEPDLAGDWRGVFAHKNIASPVFGVFAYVGFYLTRVGRWRAGVAIGLASLVFLFFTHGKTSSALWLPAGALGFYLANRPSGWAGRALALGPPLLITAIGFGVQISGSLAAALPFDTSFTGRSAVWRFAATKIAERPIAGHGFDSFWDDPALRANAEQGWVASAAHAHNGYIDAMLAMGAVGLMLTLWALALQPLADLAAAARRGEDRPLTILCAQILIYGLWVSSLETFLYDRANPVWFLYLFAVFTLRYLASFRVAP